MKEPYEIIALTVETVSAVDDYVASGDNNYINPGDDFWD